MARKALAGGMRRTRHGLKRVTFTSSHSAPEFAAGSTSNEFSRVSGACGGPSGWEGPRRRTLSRGARSTGNAPHTTASRRHKSAARRRVVISRVIHRTMATADAPVQSSSSVVRAGRFTVSPLRRDGTQLTLCSRPAAAVRHEPEPADSRCCVGPRPGGRGRRPDCAHRGHVVRNMRRLTA
jgi:hypothetical protein